MDHGVTPTWRTLATQFSRLDSNPIGIVDLFDVASEETLLTWEGYVRKLVLTVVTTSSNYYVAQFYLEYSLADNFN